jgi:hypothetical protein
MTTPALAQNVKGRGRHYPIPGTDRLVPSVTNIVGTLDKPALPRWAAKQVAIMAWELRTSLPNLAEDEAIDLLKGSPWRKSQRAANRGTTIHEWLQARVRGTTLPPVEGEAALYVQAAEAWYERFQPQAIHTEVTLFSDGYAGTADAILEIDDQVWLVDYKTSSGLYPEVALQLSALATCDTLQEAGHEAQNAPAIDRVAAVRIGTDGDWEMREVEDVRACAEAFDHLLQVWNWKHDGNPLGGKIK